MNETCQYTKCKNFMSIFPNGKLLDYNLFSILTYVQEDELLLAAEEGWRLPGVKYPAERNINSNINICCTSKKIQTIKLYTPPDTKANELTLKRLAKSAFEQQQTEGCTALTISSPPSTSEAPVNLRPSFEGEQEKACKVLISILFKLKYQFHCSYLHFPTAELHESDEYFDEGSFLTSIPQDFICPLTGQLFEEPVTLESGQTFECEAIKEWIEQGNRTCPVTGKYLACPSLPLTNFILKRVIDGWKSENCMHLLAFAFQIVEKSRMNELKNGDETAIFILEQLLTVFSDQERITNAKHLISIGGLQFLICRFESGKLEEKARVAALMCCCIEADAGCRNQMARNINVYSLLELLHSKQVKPRTNAVLLLTDLICLSRCFKFTHIMSAAKLSLVASLTIIVHQIILYIQFFDIAGGEMFRHF